MKRIDLRRYVSTGLGAAIFALGAVSATPVAAAVPPPPPPAPTRYVVSPTPVHHDVSAPLASMQPANYDFQSSARGNDRGSKPLPKHINGPAAGAAASASAPSTNAPTSGINFDGIGKGGSYVVCCAPPDTNASVGPNHIVEAVNLDLAVFNKSGALVYGPVPINTLWSGFGDGCQIDNDGDPTALYDPMADRWIISQFAVTTTLYLNCVAVSTSPDPTGTYNRYSFRYNDFPDYPKFGIWPDAYYVTFNMFAGGITSVGGTTCAYDRAKMLTGAMATQQCFNAGSSWSGLLPSTVNGATAPPTGAPNYVLGLDTSTTSTRLAYWKFHVDWTTPASTTMTGPAFLTVSTYTNSCSTFARGDCIPQGGGGTNLESLADRLMYRLNYRNLGGHEALVVNHTIEVGSGSTLQSGVRWYEIRPDASRNLSVFQEGTYAPDANWRWMGSINMDQSGNIAMGYSVSSSSIKPQIHYTGRLVGDALGTMSQGENVIINGGGAQTGGLARWGDYSSMAVDPVDDCTFFHANEYLKANGAFNWSTRIASFKLGGCPAPDFRLAISPTSQSVSQGNGTTYTVTIAPINGFNGLVQLSAGGLPAGAAATFSPNPATSTSTMTVTTSSTTPTGNSTTTVTGTTGSLIHTATTTLAVIASVLAYVQSPQGNWAGTYGADGYALLGWNGTNDLVSLPQSSLVLDQGLRYQWSAATTAVQSLQSPDASIRRAACFYDWSQIRLHLVFPAAYSGTLHLYALDWDSSSRRETIAINDGSGPRSADISSDFSQGAWVNAPVNVLAGGSVTISVTRTAGVNAVLSGVVLGEAGPVPAAPTALTASAASPSKISLSWMGSSGASSYKIQRSPDVSTGWSQVGSSITASFTDSGLNPSTTYFYRVLASNRSGDSAPSTVASASTGAGLAYAQSPQGNWVGSYGADGYSLLGWNGTSDLASMPQSSLALDQGVRYQWIASSTSGQSLQSPDASTRRPACLYDYSQIRLHLVFPAAYSGTLHLYALDWDTTSRRETITVNDGSGPRSADISTDFSQGAWVNGPINIPAGGSLTISVTRTGGNNAVLSGIFLGGAIPAPAAPTSLTASVASSSKIDLGWTGSSGASSYKIQRSADGSTGWSQVGSSITVSFTDTGLTPSTIYSYRVLASNGGADSLPSNVASATTGASLAFTQSPQGNWVGSYGADGYALLGWNGTSDLASMPKASLVLDQGVRCQWAAATTAVQSLQSPDASNRRAACFYDYSQIRLHLVFPAAYSGTVHLYALDWDSTSRRESITINDGSGPRTADISSAFNQGAWVNAPINVPPGGSLTISVTLTAGVNAVLSGIFLG